LQQGHQFFTHPLKTRVIIVALEKLVPAAIILSNEHFALRMFKPEGVDVLVVLEKVVIVSEIEDNFIDVVFGTDG
jgi:hypothetical protein